MKQEIASMAQGLQAWHMIWGNAQPGTGAGGQYRSGQISASPSEELASFTPCPSIAEPLELEAPVPNEDSFPLEGASVHQRPHCTQGAVAAQSLPHSCQEPGS